MRLPLRLEQLRRGGESEQRLLVDCSELLLAGPAAWPVVIGEREELHRREVVVESVWLERYHHPLRWLRVELVSAHSRYR